MVFTRALQCFDLATVRCRATEHLPQPSAKHIRTEVARDMVIQELEVLTQLHHLLPCRIAGALVYLDTVLN
jgi:hypothetical protein